MVGCNSLSTTKVLSVVLLLTTLVFWIWLMEEAVRTVHQCPDKCSCVATAAVDCTNVSLQEIPTDLHKEIRHLTLSCSNISILTRNQFFDQDLTALKILTLDCKGIVTIESGAFNGLPKLSNLHLQNNKLSTLRSGMFFNLTKLLGLYLAGNKIKVIYSGVFRDLENLGYLSLECNEIEELYDNMFIGLSNLKNLWLTDNKITYLHPDVFKHMPNLNLVSLSKNKELFVPTDRSFLNVRTLNKCLLSGCNIKNLSAKSFEKSPNLTSLNFENNRLPTIDVNIVHNFLQLKDLQLFGNPLECDCRLMEVWKWCRKYDIITGYEDDVPTCVSPEEVSGLWWGVLEKAQCFNGLVEFQGDYKSIVHDRIPYNSQQEHLKNLVVYVQSTVYALLFLIGSIGNITVMTIIACNKRMQSVPNAYLFNLAVGDLLFLIMNIPLSHTMSLSPQWILGDAMCRMMMFCHQLSLGVSVFSVALLSVQRQYATSGSSHLSTKRATIIIIATVWFIACCCALPGTFSVHVEFDTICSPFYSREYYKMTIIFYLLVFCIIPLCVIVPMYAMTARHLVQRTQCSEEEIRRCKTLAEIIIGLTFVFFISFIPYHVLMFVLVWINPSFELYVGYLIFVSQCLLALNPCLNPISLYCTSVTFKKLFKHYLLCFYKRSTKEDESDLPQCEQMSVHYRHELATEAVIL